MERDGPRLEQLHKEVIKDLDSLLLPGVLSLVYSFHSLGGKTVSEPPGLVSGPQAGRRCWTKGKAHTSCQSFLTRKMIAPGKCIWLTSINILLTRTMWVAFPFNLRKMVPLKMSGFCYIKEGGEKKYWVCDHHCHAWRIVKNHICNVISYMHNQETIKYDS